MLHKIKELNRIHLFLGIAILMTLPCYCSGLALYWAHSNMEITPQLTATFISTYQNVDTITPTFTYPVVTCTQTETLTVTPTFTQTVTYVLPPTCTPTPSLTPTDTDTPTASPVSTETYTPTASDAPTEQSTDTATATDTGMPVSTNTP